MTFIPGGTFEISDTRRLDWDQTWEGGVYRVDLEMMQRHIFVLFLYEILPGESKRFRIECAMY